MMDFEQIGYNLLKASTYYNGFALNSMSSSDAIWQHKSGSILVQFMACCLTAPSHYLNQSCLIIGEIQ